MALRIGTPALLLSLLPPLAVRTLPATAWLHAPQQGGGNYVSPLAGCEGFDCVLQYIALPDNWYSWYDTKFRLTGTIKSDTGNASVPWTGYILNMTSQRWQTRKRVDFPVWWHTLVVIVPQNLQIKDWATIELNFGIHKRDGELIRIDNRHVHEPVQDAMQSSVEINSGNLERHLPELKQAVQQAAFLAARTRAASASLLNLPNAEETFADDPVSTRRAGDYLKAFTYADFLDHPDEPERIMDLPTAKAVVRAMDTVAAFTATLPAMSPVTRFGVTGYSKLGTATWITAAADERVKAIVPVAIYLTFATLPTLMPPPENALSSAAAGLERQAAYVAPESAESPYLPVALSMATSEFHRLLTIIDPLYFSSRLGLPKLVIMAANDAVVGQFEFQVTELLPQLRGRSAYNLVPNCEHDASLMRSLPSIAAFFRGFLLGLNPPAIEFQLLNKERALGVRQARDFAKPPVAVRLWSGSPVKRFTGSALAESPPGSRSWVAKLPSGAEPEMTSFVSLEYEWPEPGYFYTISTPRFT
mmetsp:Transcript_101649/g.282926  ORF Transcript_101649/g.282926 Transcript_101649/m.282926 type:complete len:531 (+) Transcript_101649:48-1640(+)